MCSYLLSSFLLHSKLYKHTIDKAKRERKKNVCITVGRRVERGCTADKRPIAGMNVFHWFLEFLFHSNATPSTVVTTPATATLTLPLPLLWQFLYAIDVFLPKVLLFSLAYGVSLCLWVPLFCSPAIDPTIICVACRTINKPVIRWIPFRIEYHLGTRL